MTRTTFLRITTLTAAAAPADRYAIYKSTDQGRTWARSDTGRPGNARINAFGATIAARFAGTDIAIFITRDTAKTWRQITTNHRVITFATRGQTIYAGTAAHGLLQSFDGGNTWTTNPLPAKNIRSPLAHAGRLFAGTDKDGVFVNAGALWTRLANGLPERSQIFAMAMQNGQLFVALYAKGIYKWAAGSQHWERAGNITPFALASIGNALIAGHNPGSLFRSDDQGANWSPVQQQEINPIWELAANSFILAAAQPPRR